MNVSMFCHDRNDSPTVRALNAAAQVRITDRILPEPIVPPTGPRRVPRRPEALPRITYHPNQVIETRAPNESFTTVTWPADHEGAAPIEPAHIALDVRYLHSLEAQAYLTQKIHDVWGGRPVLHAFEQTTASIRRNLEGKDTHESAVQTFINCKIETESLHRRYMAFAADASQLVANRAGNGHGVRALVSAPLLRIAQSIWPTLRFNSGMEKTTWVKRTLRHPEPFIAQSYDALSLALGRVGVGITQAKVVVYDTACNKSADEKNSIVQSILETDTAFIAAEAALDNVGIPIDPSILKGHGVLAIHGMPSW